MKGVGMVQKRIIKKGWKKYGFRLKGSPNRNGEFPDDPTHDIAVAMRVSGQGHNINEDMRDE